jgi:hypothetical protein
MTRLVRRAWFVLAIVCVSGTACQLKRPDTIPVRMLEPQLLELQPAAPTAAAATSGGAMPVRLLDTQARAHIGRRLLHQQASGELTEDPVWRWSAAPDRYLDTAIRLELESSSRLRLVDTAGSPAIAATLLTWCLEPGENPRLTWARSSSSSPERTAVVHSHVVQGSEPVSGGLPGDLAAVAGRLLRRLAQEGLMRAA